MAWPREANDTMEHHEWKSEFAQEKSGRTSPTFFSKIRRRYLTAPPVRSVNSPKFTEEELDALTGDVPYETSYTYAFSKIYDPTLPDHWQVPNLRGASPIMVGQEHQAATSIARKAVHFIFLPFVLIFHLFLYVVSSLYNGSKLTVVTFFDYVLYCLRGILGFLLPERRNMKTKRVMNTNDNFRPVAYMGSSILEAYRRFVSWISMNSKVERSDVYGSNIDDGNYQERNGRIITRETRSTLKRGFDAPSLSPARSRARNVAERTTTRIISSYSEETPRDSLPLLSDGSKSSRYISKRSVTPTRGRVQNYEDREDTPLSVYGLRSRNINRDTPEPTFEARDFERSLRERSHSRRNGGARFADDSAAISNRKSGGSIFADIFFSIVSFPYDIAAWLIVKAMQIVSTQQKPAVHVRRSTRKIVKEVEVVDPDYASTEKYDDAFFSRDHPFITNIALGIYRLFRNIFVFAKEFVGSLLGSFFNVCDGILRKFNCYYLLPLLLLLILLFPLFLPHGNQHEFVERDPVTGKYHVSQQTGSSTWQEKLYDGTYGRAFRFLGKTKNFIINLVFEPYAFLKGTPNNIALYGGKTINLIKNAAYGAVDIAGKTVNKPFHVLTNFAKSTVYRGGRALKFAGLMLYRPIEYAGQAIMKNAAFLQEIPANISHYALNGLKTFGSIAFEIFLLIGEGVRGFGAIIRYNVGRIYFFFKETLINSSQYLLEPFSSLRRGLSATVRTFVINPWKFFTSSDFWGNFKAAIERAREKEHETPKPVVFEHGETEIHAAKVPKPPSPLVKDIVHDEHAPSITKSMPIEQPVVSIIPKSERDRKAKANPGPAHQEEEEEKKEELIPITIPRNEAPEIPIIRPSQQAPIIELDQAKIIADITEKLRAELSVQFHKELSTQIEKNYKSVIEKLIVHSANKDAGNTNLEALIRQMIYEYDADKTGQVDYALESSGASVLSTRCSETYNSYSRLEKIWNIPLWYSTYGPRTVIQRNSKTLFPGECWSFKGGRGYLTVDLSHHIDISSVSYEHIGKELAPGGNRQSAPKKFKIWAYRQVDDLESRVLVGDYFYDLDGPQLQFFITQNEPGFPVKIVELEINENYGAEFTCLYRLRVHGKVHHF